MAITPAEIASSPQTYPSALKRVLFIVPQPFFATRGSPMRVRATVENLIKLGGYEVDLLVLPLGEPFKFPKLTIYRSPRIFGIKRIALGPSLRKFILDIGLCCSAIRLASKKRYDIFHGVEEAAILCALLSMIFRAPFIMDMHSSMSKQIKDMNFFGSSLLSSLVSGLERIALRLSSGVITVADLMTRRVLEVHKHTNVVTLPDLPLQMEPISPQASEALVSELSIAGAPVILYTGNLHSYQGVELLLEGFAALISDSPQHLAVLVIVGGGAEEREELQRLIGRAKELGLNDRIRFLGQRPSHEMSLYFDIATVLVSPRIHGENTPLKVYSYLNTGKAVVATRIASHTQVMTDEVCYLATPTPKGLADALKAALDQSPEAVSRRFKMTESAKRLIEENYSENQFRIKLGDLYRRSLTTLVESQTDQSQPLPL